MTLTPVVTGTCTWQGEHLIFLLLSTPGHRVGTCIWEVHIAASSSYAGKIAYSTPYSEYLLYSDCGDRCYSAAEMKEIVEFCEARTKEFSERNRT